ncbi:helix-turn-helix transcriptional regulator [Pseudoflavonifractor phocaeensis]|uniref:helix-turn-helix domain-containing protein n=1 Tax=Pseudoflavonifractor phocaeensis TaxID=1870988 RepID=UPI0025A4AC3A|nr:helix-turn-helix transcriptional regulator [Pseudoflavonifractor phocaeensis]MDM8238432.1 helix-turn-helix transcriptional regulator [Pseudoflavonifractor phocaeensis]
MNEQEFAQRLRQYRKDKGMTQQELADKLGVSNKTVSRWESGSYPDVATLVALARALGVTVDELLDPKTPVRTLQKSDWQNLLSFAFAIGGGLLFYLLGQFVPLPLCWMLYLGCLAYGIYLQAHYTYHTRWFQLGVWIMVLFVSGSVAGMLLTGAAVLFGISSAETFLTNQIGMLLQGDVDGRLLAVLLMWTMIWLILTAALGLLTAFVAKQLAREPASGSVLPNLAKEQLPRLCFRRASFHWSKAVPALAPLVLMGYWCLFWRDDLPGWLYVSQKELYLPVWAGISLLILLPLLKKGRRGLLIPAVLLALTSRGFSGLLVYPRAYSLISQKMVVDKTNGLLSGNHIYFGQAGAELMVFAVVLALLYLACCFLSIRYVPKEEKQEQSAAGEGDTF